MLLAITLSKSGLWWSNLLILVGIYSLLALSLNLINGHAGMFSLGHHGFWALGAYGAAWLAIRLHGGALSGPVIYGLSCLFAMGIATLGGLLIGIPCLRLRGDYLAVATLGFGEILRIAIQNSPVDFLGGSIGLEIPRVLMRVTPKTRSDFRLLTLSIVAGLCLLLLLALRNLVRSAPGRRLMAVAQDETAAGLLGINPTKSKVLAFAMGSAGAGLAGAVYAHYQAIITPLDFNFMQTVKIFLIIVLGGMGSLWGCLLGALLVVGLEQGLSRAPRSIADWWQVIFPVLLALMILFRPQGIFGRRRETA